MCPRSHVWAANVARRFADATFGARVDSMDTAQTLLLNQGFEPIKVISWQRAITLLFLGKVEVLEEYGKDIRSVNVIIKVPAVVRLLRAFRRHSRPVKFSRVNIYARDNYKCQYCGKKA